MKKIITFSKKISDVSKLKSDFFHDNKVYLDRTTKGFKLYLKEKKRLFCKNCENKLGKNIFKSNNVSYIICEKCSHLNGAHRDTVNFLNKLYLSEKGSSYEKGYTQGFNERVKKIYTPKLNFLKKVIKKKFSVIEIGSGAGHFVKACENQKIKVKGYEINRKLVQIAKKNNVKNIFFESPENINQILENDKSDVVSLISTLEHLPEPNKILKIIKKSKIKYIYTCIPLFSLSTFIENVFPKVYPRQLNASHTHLYTQKSLEYMVKKYKFKILGEWWFGTDIADLYRSLVLSSNYQDKSYIDIFNKCFGNHIDDFQEILDKKKLSCEVHLVLKI